MLHLLDGDTDFETDESIGIGVQIALFTLGAFVVWWALPLWNGLQKLRGTGN